MPWELTEPCPCSVLSLGNLVAAPLKYHLYGDDSGMQPLSGLSSPCPNSYLRGALCHLVNVSPPSQAQHGQIRAFNLSFSARGFPELSNTRMLLCCQNLSAVFISCLLPCLHILGTSTACITLLSFPKAKTPTLSFITLPSTCCNILFWPQQARCGPACIHGDAASGIASHISCLSYLTPLGCPPAHSHSLPPLDPSHVPASCQGCILLLVPNFIS